MVTRVIQQRPTTNCSALLVENKHSEKFVLPTMDLTSASDIIIKTEISELVEQEQDQQEQREICIPNNSDVLAGRGNGVGCHPGNHKFREIAKQYHPQYINGATTREKTQIVMNIMKKIESSGGRFLKLDHTNNYRGEWVCMTLDESRKKTAQALRDITTTNSRHQSKLMKRLKRGDDSNLPPLNQHKPLQDSRTNSMKLQDEINSSRTNSMKLQDEINSKMMNNFKKEIDRIRGDMNKLKRKYDQLDREQLELTRNFMRKIVAGDKYENEI